ncbi:MAG: hypothetical protein ACWGQW_14900 [bacterium]
MAILEADIVYRYSVKSGSAGDTEASTPDASLGKYMSTSSVDLGVPANNLFDDVNGQESSAGDVEYRCFFILNDHATLTLVAPFVWLEAEVGGGADVAIGLDPAGVVPRGQAGAQAAEIATEDNAPVGVSFSSPTSKATGLAASNIPPDYCQAVWVRRTVAPGTAAKAGDGVTIRVEGDSPA